ncbi:hypothetical protein GCM10025873_20030 [Demequina sediminis]|nr:hypothetical protein GCM10025873_20030 [Demequina sediminis]
MAGREVHAALRVRPARRGIRARLSIDRLLDYVEDKLPAVFAHLEAARDDLLAFTTSPKDVWT